MNGWTEEDTPTVSVKSERQAVLRIGQGTRYDCAGYFSIVTRNADFRQLIGSLDALASTQPLYIAGVDAAVDIRHYFTHGRRWHVRMGGIRPFDYIRTSARLHISTCRLRTCNDSHPGMDEISTSTFFGRYTVGCTVGRRRGRCGVGPKAPKSHTGNSRRRTGWGAGAWRGSTASPAVPVEARWRWWSI